MVSYSRLLGGGQVGWMGQTHPDIHQGGCNLCSVWNQRSTEVTLTHATWSETSWAAVAQGQSQRLVIWRSLVRFPWSACQSVLGHDTEAQTAPDVSASIVLFWSLTLMYHVLLFISSQFLISPPFCCARSLCSTWACCMFMIVFLFLLFFLSWVIRCSFWLLLCFSFCVIALYFDDLHFLVVFWIYVYWIIQLLLIKGPFVLHPDILPGGLHLGPHLFTPNCNES